MSTPILNVFEPLKDTHFSAEMKAVYDYLYENSATASMVELATGIHHKNITWYKRMLEEAGKLKVVKNARCKRTGNFADYLTTNPNNFPTRVQMDLFDGLGGFTYE